MTEELDISFILVARYKKPVITLEEVIKDYLPHLTIETAKRRANLQTLPFPTFRGDLSSKSPWFVNITDLAFWLENSRNSVISDWQAMQ